MLSRPINWDLIADQYDQMIRYTEPQLAEFGAARTCVAALQPFAGVTEYGGGYREFTAILSTRASTGGMA